MATYLCYVAGFAAVLGTAVLLSRLLVGGSLTALLAVAALLVYFQPIRRNFYFAQVDTLVLFLLMLALWLFTRRRDAWAGVAVAVAVAIKPFAGFVLLYFLWKRSYRAAAALLVGSGVLVVGPLLALGPHTIGQYIDGTTWWVSRRLPAPSRTSPRAGCCCERSRTTTGRRTLLTCRGWCCRCACWLRRAWSERLGG